MRGKPQVDERGIENDQLRCLNRITNRFILPPANPDTVDANEKTNIQTAAREADALLDILIKRNDGVDIAHDHAKYLSKYMFSLVHYAQERSVEELSHADRASKLLSNGSLPSFLNNYRFLPGIDLMIKHIKKDSEYYSKMQSTWMLLQTHEFVGVSERKLEIERATELWCL